MEVDEIMQQYSEIFTHAALQNYLLPYSIDTNLIDGATLELSELINQIKQFENVNNVMQYHQILDEIATELCQLDNEEEILEQIIPRWQTLKNNFLIIKPIDQFYYEVELFILLKLFSKMLTNTLQPLQLKKIRSIIRRYSNMPCFWLILPAIDGNNLDVLYTF